MSMSGRLRETEDLPQPPVKKHPLVEYSTDQDALPGGAKNLIKAAKLPFINCLTTAVLKEDGRILRISSVRWGADLRWALGVWWNEKYSSAYTSERWLVSAKDLRAFLKR